MSDGVGLVGLGSRVCSVRMGMGGNPSDPHVKLTCNWIFGYGYYFLYLFYKYPWILDATRIRICG